MIIQDNNQIVENAMKEICVLPANFSSQNLINPSQPLNLTKNKQYQSSQNLVNPSQNLVNPSQQLNSTTKQQLSEQGKQAKSDLEILVATGKTKDLIGKTLTFNDLDYMSEKDLLKYHRTYQSAIAVRVNDSFSKIAIKSYTKLTKWFLPINDEDKLYEDLRNDYILMNEIDKWTGWLSLRTGSFIALASVGLITLGSCGFSTNINERDREPQNAFAGPTEELRGECEGQKAKITKTNGLE